MIAISLRMRCSVLHRSVRIEIMTNWYIVFQNAVYCMRLSSKYSSRCKINQSFNENVFNFIISIENGNFGSLKYKILKLVVHVITYGKVISSRSQNFIATNWQYLTLNFNFLLVITRYSYFQVTLHKITLWTVLSDTF